MAIIREDIYGLYSIVGGYIVRPYKPTQFRSGDKTVGKHFGGSMRVGMGKAEGRGQYQEYWSTSGVASEHKKGIIKTIEMHRGY